MAPPGKGYTLTQHRETLLGSGALVLGLRPCFAQRHRLRTQIIL
jgi:hypothetical protein